MWMFAGNFIYAFTIGSVSSLIASIDARETSMVVKIGVLREYKKRYNLSYETYLRIKAFFEN